MPFIVMFPCNPCCHLAGPRPKLKLALSLNSAAPPTGNPGTPKQFWRKALCVCEGWRVEGRSHDIPARHQPSMPSNQRAGRKCGRSEPQLLWSSSLFRLYLERQRSSYGVHSVACTGQEVHLAACPLEFSTANSTFPCRGGGAAVVACMPGPAFLQGSGLKKKLKVSVRMNGQTAEQCSE